MPLRKRGLRRRAGVKRRGLRRGRGKFRKSGGKISLMRGPAGIPDRVTLKLNYAATGQNNVAAFEVEKQFRLNSIYDPEYALGGQSVAGLAQWSALYNRYRVYKVDYEYELVNVQGISSIIGAVVPAPAGFTLFSWGELATQAYARKFMLAPQNGMNRTKIRGSIYLPKLEGQSNIQYMSGVNNSALVNANPSNTNFLYLICQTPSQDVAQICVLQWTVKLRYHVELFDRKNTYVNNFNIDDEDIGRIDLSGNVVPNTILIVGEDAVPPPKVPENAILG